MTLLEPETLKSIREIMKLVPTNGIFLEVGVYQGGSALELQKIATQNNQELWLFDTFEGMPEDSEIDFYKKGHFADCNYNAVKNILPEAKIFKGFFPETFLKIEEKKKIAFAHIDCDQYESIKNCIIYLSPFMVENGIMWFDDYGYSHLPGSSKAIDELLPNKIIHPCGRAYYVF